MVTFEECAQMLDEIADSMPFELYRKLNGGMSLLPEKKLHPKACNGDLYILGEYKRNSLGKYIVFYYGSLNRVYGHLPKAEFYQKLKGVLAHEVRHHNEYLAGVDDLIIYDKEQIDSYLERKNKQK